MKLQIHIPMTRHPTRKLGRLAPEQKNGSGVDQHRIPEYISGEMKRELAESGQPTIRTSVTFDDVPVIISASLKVDEYDMFSGC